MQRYFSNKLINNHFILDSSDVYHINTVMRMKNNDYIEIVYENKVHICRIDNDKYIIDKVIEQDIFNKEIIMCIPLLKESKMDFILQKATELNVTKIIPIEMKHSIIKLDKNKELSRITRWNKICKEASEQSKRIDIPIISNVLKFQDIIKLEGKKLICSTVVKDNTINKVLNRDDDKIIFVFGPEGGFSKDEEQYLIDNDFIPVSFGNTILRTETVPLYVLSIINFLGLEG